MHVLLESMPPTLQQATTDPRLCRRLLDTHTQVWDSLLWVTVPFSWVLVHKVLLCPPRVYSQSCVSSGSSMVVNGDLLQEDLCHTHSQSPCPCSRLLPTRTSTGDDQTQFCVSLCGVPGSWCTQEWFEPSECLWQERGLTLNVNSPLLPSCWGFSIALGRGVSPHSHSSTYHLTGVSLILDMGYLHMAGSATCSHLLLFLEEEYLFTAAPVKRRHCS